MMTNQELIRETSNTMIEYLPKLQKGISDMCDSFRKGMEKEGLHLFPSILDGINWVIRAIEGLNKITENMLPKIEDIYKVIVEMLNSFERRDFVLLTDLFEYEINPFLAEIEIINQEYNDKNVVGRR